MGDFVYGQEEVLVGRGADYVGCEEDGPGDERCVVEAVGTEDLEADYCEDERDCERLWTAEFENLRIGLGQRLLGMDGEVLCTSGCAFMIACLLVLCGSSVYVQKNLS